MSSPHPSFESKAFESFWATPAGSGLNALSASELTLRVCCWRQWHTGFHAVNGSWKERRWDNTSAPEHFYHLVQLWSHLCKGELPPEFTVKNFPAADWAESQLLHHRMWTHSSEARGFLIDESRPSGGLWDSPRETWGEACLVLSRGSHVPSGSGSSWGDQDGRRWIPRPPWSRQRGGISLQLLQALGVFRGRGSWVPEAEAGLPKSDGVCFIPSTSFPNVYTMCVI